MSTTLTSTIINIKNTIKNGSKNSRLDLTLILKPKALTTVDTFDEIWAFPFLTKKFAIIINEFKTHDFEGHFFNPVSANIEKHYNTKIKHPIHFNNILNKIQQMTYVTFGDIMCDINSLWDNCWDYNGLPDANMPILRGFSNYAFGRQCILNQYIEAFKNELISKKYLSLHCENIKKNKQLDELINWEIQSKPSCIHSVNIFNDVRCFPHLTSNITKIINRCKMEDRQGTFFQEITFLDYIERIEHPIHFGQILQSIENKEYETMCDIKKDIDLLFKNCYEYNGEKSEMSYFAMRLERIVNEHMNEFEILLTNNGFIKQNENLSGKKRNRDLNNVKITDMYIPIEPKLKKQKIV